jgi:hypothetical protein
VLLSVADKWKQPFVSQIQSNFNTGLIRQFAPRLNSSISISAAEAKDFPANCNNLPGSFYAEYSFSKYKVQACMPGNQTSSPWKHSRVRQDIHEILYLNMSLETSYPEPEATVFRIVANTTAGYFELPDYLNGNAASQILAKDPNNYCDQHCLAQESYRSGIINNTK